MELSTLSALAEPNRLQVLNEAHIVEARPMANQRIYKLRPEPFQEMDAWLESFRRLWEERMDRLDAYLQEIQKKT